jgi:FdhE protein
MTTWERRIERAAELEKRIPAAAELLRFYITVQRASWPVAPQPERLREVVARAGPPLLADAARNHAEPAESFITRVLRQVEAIKAAARGQFDKGGITRNTCPFCGDGPLAAVLRPEGEGAKRYLLCSLCLTEWEFRRMLCPNCGEENHEKLPVYTTKEFPHIRIEACDSCRHYVKAIDLTVEGRAVPEVDDLAAIALDLWATEHEYSKIYPNILGG